MFLREKIFENSHKILKIEGALMQIWKSTDIFVFP